MEIKIDIPNRYMIIAKERWEKETLPVFLYENQNYFGNGKDYGTSILGRTSPRGSYFTYEFHRYAYGSACVFESKQDAEKALEIFAKSGKSPITNHISDVRIVTLEDAFGIFIKENNYDSMPSFPLKATIPKLAR